MWRDYAANIKASILTGPRSFISEHSEEKGVTGRYKINLKALDTRPAGIRTTFPTFSKNAVSGTISNPTFNGVLPDLTSAGLKSRFDAARFNLNEGLNTK